MTPATCKVCGVALFVKRSIAGVDAYLIETTRQPGNKNRGVVVIRGGFAEIVKQDQTKKGEPLYLYHTHGSAS